MSWRKAEVDHYGHGNGIFEAPSLWFPLANRILSLYRQPTAEGQ